MKLGIVGLLLLCVLFLMLLTQIGGISNNNNNAENLIREEERRGGNILAKTDQEESEAKKRGLYYGPLETANRHHSYPTEYEHTSLSTYTAPGYSYGNSFVNPHYNQGANYVSGISSGHGHGYGFNNGGSYGHTGHDISFGGYHGHTNNGLALKGLLIPLAGIALLGAAAALSTNPVLLQLGVVNGRKRRRRSLRIHPSQLMFNRKKEIYKP